MILRNNLGVERDFEILFELDKNNNKYIVYKDPVTGSVYGGRLEDNTLVVLNNNEYDFINNIVDKFNS